MGRSPTPAIARPRPTKTRSGRYMAYTRTMVVAERWTNCGMLRNSRDRRVTRLTPTGTDATARPLRPAWMSISMV